MDFQYTFGISYFSSDIPDHQHIYTLTSQEMWLLIRNTEQSPPTDFVFCLY